MSAAATNEVKNPKRIPWRFPTIVCALALTVHLVGQRLVDEDLSMQSIVAVLAWFVAFLLISAWWVFFSGIRWRIRLAGVAGFVALIAVFLTLFEFEGQTGNFIPQFRLRGEPSAEEKALEYFVNAGGKTDAAEVEPANDESNKLTVTEADWARFGGPRGDHTVTNASIHLDWKANPPALLWRHPVGPGWSSFAVVGDLAFTQEQRGENECVVCYDANTGKQIWVHQDEVRFEESASGAGPRATPTVNDSKVYAIGATGLLNCLDALSGKVIWSKNVAEQNGGKLIEWAVSGSPVIHEDLVIVNPSTSSAFLAAYDRLTGEKKWSGPSTKAGYATPVVATLKGTPQVIMYHARGVGGFSLTNGEQLWSFEWVNAPQINVAQPIVLSDESVFISTGYGGGSARLDVTQSDDKWSVASRWERRNRFKLKFNGGILKDGHIFGLDEGILSCFDLEKGKRTWKKGRYSFGQILMADDHLLVLAESGDVALVKVDTESMSEVGRFSAIEGKTWNHPVLNRGRLFVRNGSEAACYRIGPVVNN